MTERRLIIVAVEPGMTPEIEYDPPDGFADWEAVAALEEAVRMVRADMEQEDAG